MLGSKFDLLGICGLQNSATFQESDFSARWVFVIVVVPYPVKLTVLLQLIFLSKIFAYPSLKD